MFIVSIPLYFFVFKVFNFEVLFWVVFCLFLREQGVYGKLDVEMTNDFTCALLIRSKCRLGLFAFNVGGVRIVGWFGVFFQVEINEP